MNSRDLANSLPSLLSAIVAALLSIAGAKTGQIIALVGLAIVFALLKILFAIEKLNTRKDP